MTSLAPTALAALAALVCIMTSFSLWRLSRLRRSQPTFSLWLHSHCDVIRYWAGHANRYGRRNVRTHVRTPYRV